MRTPPGETARRPGTLPADSRSGRWRCLAGHITLWHSRSPEFGRCISSRRHLIDALRAVAGSEGFHLVDEPAAFTPRFVSTQPRLAWRLRLQPPKRLTIPRALGASAFQCSGPVIVRRDDSCSDDGQRLRIFEQDRHRLKCVRLVVLHVHPNLHPVRVMGRGIVPARRSCKLGTSPLLGLGSDTTPCKMSSSS